MIFSERVWWKPKGHLFSTHSGRSYRRRKSRRGDCGLAPSQRLRECSSDDVMTTCSVLYREQGYHWILLLYALNKWPLDIISCLSSSQSLKSWPWPHSCWAARARLRRRPPSVGQTFIVGNINGCFFSHYGIWISQPTLHFSSHSNF